MEEIPITFEWQGKEYTGIFTLSIGSGSSSLFHLYIDKRYHGQLFYTEHFGWQFYSNQDYFTGMADYFGNYVTSAFG